MSFILPAIATLFLLGSILIGVLTRNGEAWVFYALVTGLYIYLATMWLSDLTGQIRAYREQATFTANSLVATAEIVAKKVVEDDNGNEFWLTLS